MRENLRRVVAKLGRRSAGCLDDDMRAPSSLRTGSLSRSAIVLGGYEAALRVTPLRSATLESFLSAAFSFIEVGIEQADNVVVTDALRPGDDGSIPGDLVMLDRLGRPDDGRIQDLLVGHFAGDFVRLADQAVVCGHCTPCGSCPSCR